uniref:RNase_PH domain-containing protein n=1 Tax=Mesocestoides corti TaxID=53468 RepID=A0A5K3FVB9_MESCO
TGYFTNTGSQQECGEPIRKLRAASLLRGRHAEKEGSQPEKDMDETQYIMTGVASVVDSDGRRLTCGSGF